MCLTLYDVGTKQGVACKFPFEYKGKRYDGCTKADHNKLWCSTQVDQAGQFIQDFWGNCDETCPRDGWYFWLYFQFQ